MGLIQLIDTKELENIIPKENRSIMKITSMCGGSLRLFGIHTLLITTIGHKVQVWFGHCTRDVNPDVYSMWFSHDVTVL